VRQKLISLDIVREKKVLNHPHKLNMSPNTRRHMSPNMRLKMRLKKLRKFHHNHEREEIQETVGKCYQSDAEKTAGKC
jgi:hypothetical protein